MEVEELFRLDRSDGQLPTPGFVSPSSLASLRSSIDFRAQRGKLEKQPSFGDLAESQVLVIAEEQEGPASESLEDNPVSKLFNSTFAHNIVLESGTFDK